MNGRLFRILAICCACLLLCLQTAEAAAGFDQPMSFAFLAGTAGAVVLAQTLTDQVGFWVAVSFAAVTAAAALAIVLKLSAQDS